MEYLTTAKDFVLSQPVTQKFLSLPVSAQVGSVAGVVSIGYLTQYLAWRTKEKSNKFNAYTESEDAINGLDLNGQLAVVTGCNAGIGAETVRVLVKQGCTVVMACRSLDKATKARNKIIESLKLSEEDAKKRLIVIQCDLSSLQSVKEFANKFNEQFKDVKINYLINNAGIMALPEYRETKDGFEMQFGTNHLGHFYLTKLLLPNLLLKQNGVGLSRVINLSSLGHFYLRSVDFGVKLFDDCITNKGFMGDRRKEYDAWLGYGISKSCNLLFARELAKRYKNELISVSLHPGAINTELTRHMTAYDGLRFMGEFMTSPMNVIKSTKSVSQGAATTLRCVSMTENEIQNGHYYFNCQSGDDNGEVQGACLEDKTKGNGILAQKLWELSDVLLEAKGFN